MNTRSKKESEICEANCNNLDALLRTFRKECANPWCRYPLKPVDGHNFLAEYGEVCELCHWMYHAVKRQPGLEWAHEQYKKDQARKKKIMDSEKYF